MAINYEFQLDGKILIVTAKGKDDNLEQTMSYAHAILTHSIENECTEVLCDERELEYSLSVIDTFELAETASQNARSIKKIAIVCDQKYLKDGNFYETVAQNRGLTVKVLTDYDEAMKWLKQNG